MLSSLLYRAGQLPGQAVYWLGYALLGLSAIATALYHQHILDEPPCVVCIHVRILFISLILVAVFALMLRHQHYFRYLANSVVVIITAIMIERSYLLLGTERGFIFVDCGFDLGMPRWLDIEQWIPALFRVETTCGYTPEVFFSITMAEMLLVLSIFLFLLSTCTLIADIISKRSSR